MPQAALKVLDGDRASKCSSTGTAERDARAEFDGIVAWVKDQAREPRRFVSVETALVSRVFALGRLLAGLYLALREERVAEALPPRACVAGQWYERRPPQRRWLGTFFGKLRYWRTYLLPEGRKGQGFHPLDRELGLTADRFSLHVISMACRLAVQVPFSPTRARVTSGLFSLALGDPLTRDVYTPRFWRRMGWQLARVTPGMWVEQRESVLGQIARLVRSE